MWVNHCWSNNVNPQVMVQECGSKGGPEWKRTNINNIYNKHVCLKSVLGPQYVIWWFAPASQDGSKGTDTRLQHQSERFPRKKTYTGRRRPKAAAPLCRWLSPKLLEQLLFSLQGRLIKSHLWTYLTFRLYCFLDSNMLSFSQFHTSVALQGGTVQSRVYL